MRLKKLASIVNKFNGNPRVKKALRENLSEKGYSIQSGGDIMGAYMKVSGSYDLLTAEQERSLFGAIEEGFKLYDSIESLDNLSKEQEDVFIEATIAQQLATLSNLRLAINFSKPYWKANNIEEVDLIQEANIGLMRAVAMYDANKGFRFSTYAANWIKSTTGRAAGEKTRLIRLPAHRHDLYLSVLRKVNKLRAESSDGEPTKEQIEKATEMEYGDYLELLRQGSSGVYSLDAPVGDDSDSALLGELIPDTVISVEEEAVRSERKRIFYKLLSSTRLNANQKFILGLRNGLEPSYFPGLKIIVKDGSEITYEEAAMKMPTTDGLTLMDIGTMMQLTRERVRQLESKAFASLQQRADQYQKVSNG
jgi:RNA polymerase primary sigma factor